MEISGNVGSERPPGFFRPKSFEKITRLIEFSKIIFANLLKFGEWGQISQFFPQGQQLGRVEFEFLEKEGFMKPMRREGKIKWWKQKINLGKIKVKMPNTWF